MVYQIIAILCFANAMAAAHGREWFATAGWMFAGLGWLQVIIITA